MYLDEEGKFKQDCQVNPRATALATGIIQDADFIVGDVVLLGTWNEHGEDTDLPEAAEKLLAAMAG
ncbi:DUF3846 domain-containing protein [Arthrobacter sp. zg-Y453]|uniref:DUF3846 domain-containing protein n=1 Tax=Arthrobacter caoxuetaonis TaxID=2886935 RepID=A0A9X1SDZ2_9MICC|nr:DUF3846 domain-containing protein [Arthrobacter caoxuetaonis]MCC3299653.1 DUF3846 domain-containing protein [Arthrobacter caoxuetaonis]USQ59005.1 DUF3846 domain-containing protein [Arthrobacter caoxuetaonis]